MREVYRSVKQNVATSSPTPRLGWFRSFNDGGDDAHRRGGGIARDALSWEAPWA
jgi:hypothetical protein